MTKLDDYVSESLNFHIQSIAKEDGTNPKFMKGFMDAENDPFVVSMEGDAGWQIYPCGNKYVWLDDSLLSQIEEWIDSVREEYDAYIAAEVEEEKIDREILQ